MSAPERPRAPRRADAPPRSRSSRDRGPRRPEDRAPRRIDAGAARRGPGWAAVALAAVLGVLAGALVVLVLDDVTGARARPATEAARPTRTTPPPPPTVRPPDSSVIPQAAVPTVVGDGLDEAKDRLHAQGFDVDTDGGGFLGVLIFSSWKVVAQEPAAGTFVDRGARVRIRIERG